MWLYLWRKLPVYNIYMIYYRNVSIFVTPFEVLKHFSYDNLPTWNTSAKKKTEVHKRHWFGEKYGDFCFNRSIIRIYLLLMSEYVDKKASLGVDSIFKSRIYRINTGWRKSNPNKCFFRRFLSYSSLGSWSRWNCRSIYNIAELMRNLIFLFKRKVPWKIAYHTILW